MLLAEALQKNPVKLWRESWPLPGAFIASDRRLNGIGLDDLIADDWHVEEKSVNINLSDLKLLVNKHIADGFDLNSKFEKMVKDIGL